MLLLKRLVVYSQKYQEIFTSRLVIDNYFILFIATLVSQQANVQL